MIDWRSNLNSTIDKTSIIGETDGRIIELESCTINGGIVCPDCRVEMVRLGACFSCPVCGIGSCD